MISISPEPQNLETTSDALNVASDRFLSPQYRVVDYLRRVPAVGKGVEFLHTKAGGFIGLGVGIWAACNYGIFRPMLHSGVDPYVSFAAQQAAAVLLSYHAYRVMPWRERAESLGMKYRDTLGNFILSRIPGNVVSASIFTIGMENIIQNRGHLDALNWVSFVGMGVVNYLMTDKWVFDNRTAIAKVTEDLVNPFLSLFGKVPGKKDTQNNI